MISLIPGRGTEDKRTRWKFADIYLELFICQKLLFQAYMTRLKLIFCPLDQWWRNVNENEYFVKWTYDFKSLKMTKLISDDIFHKKICSKVYCNYAIMFNSYVYFVQHKLCIAWKGVVFDAAKFQWIFGHKKGECTKFHACTFYKISKLYIYFLMVP